MEQSTNNNAWSTAAANSSAIFAPAPQGMQIVVDYSNITAATCMSKVSNEK
jgi:hypothetical protein